MKLKEFLNDVYNDIDYDPNDFIIIGYDSYEKQHLIHSMALGRLDGNLLKRGLTDELLDTEFISLDLIGTTYHGSNKWYIQVRKVI